MRFLTIVSYSPSNELFFSMLPDMMPVSVSYINPGIIETFECKQLKNTCH